MHGDRTHCARCAGALLPADPTQGPRPFRLPGDAEHFTRARPWDITHLALSLTVDPDRGRIEGSADVTLTRRAPEARTVTLDAVAMTIVAVVRTDGAPRAVPWRYDGERLDVRVGDVAPGASARITVTYEATPKRGLHFIRPDSDRPDRPMQVWSQCQDEDARYWFPCIDAPVMRHTTEMRVRVPRGWRALSNGRLVEHRTDDVHAHWHWHQEQPHAPYLVTLVAGTFAELDASDDAGIPCHYYVDPGQEDAARRTLHETPAMLRHFAALTGVAYPWARYDQVTVHAFSFGGMENTACTTLTERMLLDERAALDVSMHDLVAHELAHQWFGDLVTCRDWSHAWLNEGFATFFEHVDLERREGRDAYLYNLKDHADAYLHEDEGQYRRPIVCATWAAPIDVFDRHLYEKGGLVLHMLRAELGDAVFWRGVKLYLDRHRGSPVETRDLVRAMEDASGRALEAFFDQWVFHGGHPEVEVEARHDADAGTLHVTVRQTQAVDAVTPRFRFTLRVCVVDDAGERTHDLDVWDAAHGFTLRCERAPRRVAVDPACAVLMRLTQKLPRDWLLDALAHDERASVRWRAAASLVRRDDARVVDALGAAMLADPFWGVAAECARALAEIRGESAFRALVAALRVQNPHARRCVVAALGAFRTDAAADVLARHLQAGDVSCRVEAELARALGATRRPSARDELLAAVDRPSWREVVRVGAIDGLRLLRDPAVLPRLEGFTGRNHPSSVRRAAVLALAAVGDTLPRVREHLESLLDEDHVIVTPAVLHALASMRQQPVTAAIARCADVSGDPRVRRAAREVLRGLQGRRDGDEQRRLRDDVESLRDELRGLRDALDATRHGASKGRAVTTAKAPTKTAKRPVKRTAKRATKTATTGRRGR